MPAEADNEVQVAQEQGPCPGELLRQARTERGLSVEQVAESLHLDEPVVEALEAGRFEAVGAPVFVRGHLKAYARVLRIPDEPLLVAYRGLQPDAAPALQQAGSAAPGSGLNLNPGPWAIGVLGACLAIGLVFYVLQDDPEQESDLDTLAAAPETASDSPPAAAASNAAPLLPAPRLVTPPADTAAQTPAPEQARTQVLVPVPEVVTPPAPEPVLVDVPVAEESEGRELELYFREESWAEISDAQQRILFGLQREGMRRQLTGEPPFQILLGNASGVDVYLDGEVYPVPRRKRGKVARFIITPTPTEGRL